MIKLIHGADLHLDSPFSGLTPLSRRLGRMVELPQYGHSVAVVVSSVMSSAPQFLQVNACISAASFSVRDCSGMANWMLEAGCAVCIISSASAS